MTLVDTFILLVVYTSGMNQINKTKMNDKKYYPKRVRAVKKFPDMVEYTRDDSCPAAIGIRYIKKYFDLESEFSITKEQYVKDIVNMKESGYDIRLMEQ